MADGVQPTDNDRKIARDGMYLQFAACFADESGYPITDVDAKIDSLGIRSFIENEIEVIASLRAQERFLENILNQQMIQKTS